MDPKRIKMFERILDAISRGYTIENGDVFNIKGEKIGNNIDGVGYPYFSFRVNKKVVKVNTHKLVAFMKYGEDMFLPGIEVRHLDGNKKNNKEDNILIGTHHENMQDIPKEVRVRTANYASSCNRKFTDDIIKKIRKDRDEGLTYSELSKKYNVYKSFLSYLFNEASY